MTVSCVSLLAAAVDASAWYLKKHAKGFIQTEARRSLRVSIPETRIPRYLLRDLYPLPLFRCASYILYDSWLAHIGHVLWYSILSVLRDGGIGVLLYLFLTMNGYIILFEFIGLFLARLACMLSDIHDEDPQTTTYISVNDTDC